MWPPPVSGEGVRTPRASEGWGRLAGDDVNQGGEQVRHASKAASRTAVSILDGCDARTGDANDAGGDASAARPLRLFCSSPY